jgi:hypothetical protein
VNSGQRSRAVAAIGSLAARDLLCTRGGTRRPRTAEAIAHSEGSPGARYVASTDGVATRKARPALTPGHSEDFVVSHPVQLQETNPPATGPGVLVHDYGQDRLEVRLALGSQGDALTSTSREYQHRRSFRPAVAFAVPLSVPPPDSAPDGSYGTRLLTCRAWMGRAVRRSARGAAKGILRRQYAWSDNRIGSPWPEAAS